jgi:hypothetical protein
VNARIRNAGLTLLEKRLATENVFERIELDNRWSILGGIPDGLVIMILRQEMEAARAACLGLGGRWV